MIEKEHGRDKEGRGKAYKKIFKNRIRKLYQQGEVGYMVSLLESESLGSFSPVLNRSG